MAISYHLLGKSHGESKGISQYFWEVVRPLVVRHPDDVTNFLLETIKHPITGEEALIIDDQSPFYNLTVHPQNSDEIIDERTELLEQAQVITTNEKTSLRGFLKSKKGEQITILDLVPSRYKTPPATKTYEEMVADGWFSYDNI